MLRRLDSIVVALLLLTQSLTAGQAADLHSDKAPSEAGARVDAPPYSRFLPPPESIALPSEQAVLNEVAAAVSQPDATPAALLDAADKALTKLPAPTKLRGFVQFIRAGALSALNRDLDAIEAIQESVRLLPNFSGPLIAASSIYSYLDRPGEGADYLVRAMDVDPQTVRTVDDYEIGNLTTRLNAVRDERRIRILSDRLLEIGWLGTRLGSRSGLAVEAIKRRANGGDLAGARTLIPKLLIPNHSYALLIQKEYEPLWPDIETWAGPRLGTQWAAYLTEAHARWAASKTAQSSLDYLSALLAARHYRSAVRDLLPMFDNPEKLQDQDLVFAVNSLAETLGRLNRWKEAENLFARAQAVWPIGESANALNISANYAHFLLIEGKPGEALNRMDESIGQARRRGPEVGKGAVSAMYHYRACILHQLGRDSETGVAVATAMSAGTPTSVASLYLCLENQPAAKKALIAGLERDELRQDIIEFVQVPDQDPLPSPYSREMRARADALRTDPEVLAAVSKYGRVLPWSANAGAPPEVP